MVHEYNDPGCRPMSVLNLAGFLARSEVNGPGIRAVVWVQGCPCRCEGCFNPEFQPFSPAQDTSISDLAARILSCKDIRGVTFSGGEPFAQAGQLAALGTILREAGLDIITYTGYTTDQMRERTDPAWQDLLSVTDLLIAGPFESAKTSNHPLAGSSNQQVLPLSDKGRAMLMQYETGYTSCVMEFSIRPEGTIITTGFPKSQGIRTPVSRCRGR